MAKCTACGREYDFLSGDKYNQCSKCSGDVSHSVPSVQTGDKASIVKARPSLGRSTSPEMPARRTIANLAYSLSIVLWFISLASFGAMLWLGYSWFSLISLCSGLFLTFVVMFLSELGHNVATLVTLANRKDKNNF